MKRDCKLRCHRPIAGVVLLLAACGTTGEEVEPAPTEAPGTESAPPEAVAPDLASEEPVPLELAPGEPLAWSEPDRDPPLELRVGADDVEFRYGGARAAVRGYRTDAPVRYLRREVDGEIEWNLAVEGRPTLRWVGRRVEFGTRSWLLSDPGMTIFDADGSIRALSLGGG